MLDVSRLVLHKFGSVPFFWLQSSPTNVIFCCYLSPCSCLLALSTYSIRLHFFQGVLGSTVRISVFFLSFYFTAPLLRFPLLITDVESNSGHPGLISCDVRLLVQISHVCASSLATMVIFQLMGNSKGSICHSGLGFEFPGPIQ